MALKFYAIETKELKLEVRMFLWLIPTFVEVTWKKTGRGLFARRQENVFFQNVQNNEIFEIFKMFKANVELTFTT